MKPHVPYDRPLADVLVHLRQAVTEMHEIREVKSVSDLAALVAHGRIVLAEIARLFASLARHRVYSEWSLHVEETVDVERARVLEQLRPAAPAEPS